MLIKSFKFCITLALSCLLSSAILAEEIIREENMPFNRCIEIINTSEDKLLIAPEISDLTSSKRVAVFALSDGTLTITCDGDKNLISVTTKMH